MIRRWRWILAAAGLAIGMGVGPVRAQEEEDVAARIRELRRELRELERKRAQEMADRLRERAQVWPRVMTLSAGRAQLGVTVQTEADEEIDEIGALLQSVTPDSPAAEAGLEAGDIIVEFDGEPLVGRYPPADRYESEPAMKLIDLVRERDAGDEVTIVYRRGDVTNTTTATLRESDDFAGVLALRGVPGSREMVMSGEPRVLDRLRISGPEAFIQVYAGPWSEMELVGLNEGLGRYFGTSEGLLVINPPDDIEGLDLQAGDVILRIGGREPRSASRALRILRSYEAGETVRFEIMRDRERIEMQWDVPEGSGERDFSFFDGGNNF